MKKLTKRRLLGYLLLSWPMCVILGGTTVASLMLVKLIGWLAFLVVAGVIALPFCIHYGDRLTSED